MQSLQSLSGIDWQVKGDMVLQPDILVVCGNIKRRLDFPPELSVEILSHSTALKDRNNKFVIYQEQKVKYYLIIDPATSVVEVYLHNGSNYNLVPHEGSYTFSFANDCQPTVRFSTIWE